MVTLPPDGSAHHAGLTFEIAALPNIVGVSAQPRNTLDHNRLDI